MSKNSQMDLSIENIIKKSQDKGQISTEELFFLAEQEQYDFDETNSFINDFDLTVTHEGTQISKNI